MSEELRCPYCNKSCSSQPGLTNHLKACKSTNAEPAMTDPDPRDIDPRKLPESPRPRASSSPPKKTNGPAFDIGAFLILEHLMIMLDLNFAAALAEHILTHGSENKAILAFGHQLTKVSGEDG